MRRHHGTKTNDGPLNVFRDRLISHCGGETVSSTKNQLCPLMVTPWPGWISLCSTKLHADIQPLLRLPQKFACICVTYSKINMKVIKLIWTHAGGIWFRHVYMVKCKKSENQKKKNWRFWCSEHQEGVYLRLCTNFQSIICSIEQETTLRK